MDSSNEVKDGKKKDGRRTVIFKTWYWKYVENDEHELFIHVSGRTASDKSVHCVIQNFKPFVYIQLPSKIEWTRSKCKILFDYLKAVMKDQGPITYKLLQKFRLHYKEPCNTMLVTFPTDKAAKLCHNKFANKNGIVINGLGAFKADDIMVHESNVDPIIKLTAAKSIKLAGWLKVKESIKEDELSLTVEDRKFTTADIDFYADWNDITPYTQPKPVIVRPRYLSFDIECDSKNHNSKLPDPSIRENQIFQLAATVGKLGDPQRRKIQLSLGDPKTVKEVEPGDLRVFKSEKELILGFKDLIVETNPDIFIGYNTMKFDWNYLIARAELLGIFMKFTAFSRVLGVNAELKKIFWSSSAYAEQEFKYLDALGRTNVDVLTEIERNYKLPKYTLESVSEFFLKMHKEDVTPRQLFMLCQLTREMTPKVEGLPQGPVDKQIRINLKKQIQNILPMRRCSGAVKTLRTDLMRAITGRKFRALVRRAFEITGEYNVQDTILPILLEEKLNLWTTMEELSNCMNVPMSYLHTRGQQIRVLAQICRKTILEDIIIPHSSKDKTVEKYQGATVIEANAGDYDNVVCYDFESLYPTTMITYNICYTTILKDDDPTPDEMCNVIYINDHVGCEHDPQHRKRKKDAVLCRKRKHRFKKVIIHEDGSRENEGLMPKLLRELLTERKSVKKEMAKLQARHKMATTDVKQDDLEFYKKMGWEIIKKGSLTEKELVELKIMIDVKNAQQNALKISANSAYGSMGAQLGYMPLLAGAESVTAKGRELIMKAIDFVLTRYPGDPQKLIGGEPYGKAKLVYGDTDSSMITFVGTSTEESFGLGDKISKEVSHYLKTYLLGMDENLQIVRSSDSQSFRIDKYPRDCLKDLDGTSKVLTYYYDSVPINLQFENLYKRYVLLTKKRYVAYAVDRKGEIISTIKKGVVLARRDGCQYLRDVYKTTISGILDLKTQKEVMESIYDNVHKLFTRQILDTSLIIYMAVKGIMNYAKKEVIGGETTYFDVNGEKIEDVAGPTDPRLVFPNLPQVLLALKMIKRGDDVPANTRLEYLYLENPKAAHQGEKAEDYTFYKENKHLGNSRPDRLHYIEKQLTKPLTELINVKYPPQKVAFEKLEEHLERLINEGENVKARISSIKTYKKTVEGRNLNGIKVGWQVRCRECRNPNDLSFGQCHKHHTATAFRTYTYKGKMAQVQLLLDSMSRGEIDPVKNRELLKVCLLYKSKYILDSISSSYKIKKRTTKRPTQSGEKLRIKVKEENVKVFLTRKLENYTKGTLVTLLDRAEELDVEHSTPKKKKFIYTYKIQFPNGKILDGVERKDIATFTYKDGNIMKDILVARGQYQLVVRHLQTLFENRENKVEDTFEVEEEKDDGDDSGSD